MENQIDNTKIKIFILDTAKKHLGSDIYFQNAQCQCWLEEVQRLVQLLGWSVLLRAKRIQPCMWKAHIGIVCPKLEIILYPLRITGNGWISSSLPIGSEAKITWHELARLNHLFYINTHLLSCYLHSLIHFPHGYYYFCLVRCKIFMLEAPWIPVCCVDVW